MGRIDFINDAKFSKNRKFYDFLMREIVCCIYESDFCGLNGNLLLPFFRCVAKGTWYDDDFEPISAMLSDKEIAELDMVICDIRKKTPKSLPELKKVLLYWMPKLTYCHLDGLNAMLRFYAETDEAETGKRHEQPYLEFDFGETA